MNKLSALKIAGKILGLLLCLFIFICSLELMSTSFQLLGARLIEKTNKLNAVLENKLAGLMIGILLTLLVQSSSTSSSIVVSMVSAKIIQVKAAIPIVMGTNIGTSITSTVVSFSQMGNNENFERAFSGAIVHDIFNFLSVIVLLPIEALFSYLEIITGLLVKPIAKFSDSGMDVSFLNKITKPLINSIIQINKTAIEELASGVGSGSNQTLLKHWCKFDEKSAKSPLVRCKFLFESVKWSDWVIGIILLLISVFLLCACLVFLVKLLNSLFSGKVSELLKKNVNSEFPGCFKYFTGYFALLIGAVLTIIIQSSSVFTSTLTPLVGIGIVSLERVFPLVLGSNIGTTITGILAALSSKASTLSYAIQIALCHLFFNISGILIWYPIPCLRRVPIKIAKRIGKITFKYKWFAFFYLFLMFLLVPILFLLLSFAGTIVLLCALFLIGTIGMVVFVLSFLQKKFPSVLPPYDKLIRRVCLCSKFKNESIVKNVKLNDTEEEKCKNVHTIFILSQSNLYNIEKLKHLA
ncbi:sodium-dependent phosphate transport 2A [Brachionus plicatilis]|uniref:Sodium-dependent phosphate transport 2A n=1 Tax=Brachionus plicatilis TaxID=10195 RepID=A0A3M7RR05_BRAPC|nr:sodium-dependent phosphate transport 2A [Brachionus plicatilis]